MIGLSILITGTFDRRAEPTLRCPIVFWLAFVGFLLSVFLLLSSQPLGIGYIDHPYFDGYLEKINWTLFPVFFPILWILCVFGWKVYVDAWKSCVGNPRSLLRKNDKPIGNPDYLDKFLKRLNCRRQRIAWWALVLGLLLTAIDFGCLWREFFGSCQHFVCRELDFTNAFKYVSISGKAPISYGANLVFDLLAYVMQGLLIALAILALGQICLNSICFLRFEQTSFAKKRNLRIVLDGADPFGEFGMFAINNAVNFNYIFIALAMVVPVVSAHVNAPQENQPDKADIGQILLRVLVPLILIVPAVASGLERNQRLGPLRRQLLLHGKPSDFEAFDKQRFWPSDQRFVGILGKAAIFACIAEYGYVAFHNYELLISFVQKIM